MTSIRMRVQYTLCPAMNTPIVSILMPTYEPNPQHLSEALHSLFAQTQQDWTLFIHDDASKSNVLGMVKPYLEDSRIRFERSAKNLGIGGNWNACVERATAPYVQFLFQDDLWGKNHLEKALEVLEANPSAGFVSLEHLYQYEGGMPVEAYERLRNFRKENVEAGLHTGEKFLLWWIRNELHPNVIGEPPFVMFRKSLLETVGPFNEKMPQFLDVEYWVRCLQKSDWYYVKEDIGAFRVHPAAASARNAASGAGIYDRFTCFEQLIASLPPGTMKKEAVAARNRALSTMAWKFFDRIKNRKAVTAKGGGGGVLKKFCLKHPFLTLRAVVCAPWNGPKKNT